MANLFDKQGGILINKHLQGGTMQQNDMEQMITAIIDGINQDDPRVQEVFQQLGEEGSQQVLQIIQQKAQQGDLAAQQAIAKLSGSVKAKLGAKLGYIRKIKGLCPEGEELVYMKKGGRMCPVCQKSETPKAEKGEKLNAVEKFKKERCGGSMKKKMAEGGKSKVDVVKTPKGTFKKYDRGEYYDYVTPTDSVSENVSGLDKKAVARLNKAEKEYNTAKKLHGKKK